MKKYLIILVSLIICCSNVAQVITQKGVTYRYNGRNPRTPIGNVYIKTATSTNAVLSNSSNGTFTLQLKNLQMGSPIGSVNVTKKGMIVFNQQAVDEWSVRKEPLCLILCDADEFDNQRKNLIAIGEREAKKRYDKRIKEIESKYKEESIEWYSKVHEADSILQFFRDHLGEYADMFARIDESEMDTIAQRAKELFQEGEIERAIQKFEEGQFMEKLKKTNSAINQTKTIIAAANNDLERQEKNRDEYVNSIKAQIEAYKIHGDWDKMEGLLKDLADEMNTLTEIGAYAFFLYDNRKWDEALIYYEKMQNILESQNTNISISEKKVSLYMALTCIFDELGMREKQEETCLKSVEYSRQLMDLHEDKFSSYHANTLRNLGVYYERINQFDQAISEEQKSLEIFIRLDSLNPGNYSSDIAALQNNIGLVLSKKGNKLEAKKYISNAVTIYRKLSELNHEKWDAYLSYPLTDLGYLCTDLKEFEEAEKLLREALKIRYEWTLKQPLHAEPLFGKTLFITRRLCELSNQERKDITTDLPLKLYRQLAKQLGGEFNIKLMYELNDEAGNLWEAGDFDNVLKLNLEILDIIKQLEKKGDLSNQELELSGQCYLNLGVVYNEFKKYDLCEDYFSQASKVFKKLSEKESFFLKSYSSSLGSLAFMNILHGKFKEAEKNAREALSADSTINFVHTNLASALLFQGKFEEAYKIYKQFKEEMKDDILDGFIIFEEQGIIPTRIKKDVEKIKKMISE